MQISIAWVEKIDSEFADESSEWLVRMITKFLVKDAKGKWQTNLIDWEFESDCEAIVMHDVFCELPFERVKLSEFLSFVAGRYPLKSVTAE